MKAKRFVGSFIDTPELGSIRILHNHELVVTEDGFIGSFGPHISPPTGSLAGTEVIRIPNGSFFLPTFCDLHLHAPQFLYQGTGLHLPLMEWLDQYAFKAEERIDADPHLARRTYEALARRLKEHGTGTVLLFGTIKEETNVILAEVMQAAGIRAFVGKLSMDISSRRTYVESSARVSLDAARSFTERVRSSVAGLPPAQRLVEPVLTPRFVPTCSDELLGGLGELSEALDVRVQSHLAEARDQVDWVLRERGIPDLDVFDNLILHAAQTVNDSHSPSTLHVPRYIVSRAAFYTWTGIAHCPLSNAYFSNRPFPLREALEAGVRIGLGTDIAGGYSIDVMNAMRSAVMVSRMREGERKEKELELNEGSEATKEGNQTNNLSTSWKESLHLATRGGASALGLLASTGTFTVGAPFDAQFIRLYDDQSGAGIGPLDFFDAPSPEYPVTDEMLEKWWCIGDDRNRSGLWVQGRRCYP